MNDFEDMKVRVIEDQSREAARRFKRSGVSKEEYLKQARRSLDDMRLPPDAFKGVMMIAERTATEVYGE